MAKPHAGKQQHKSDDAKEAAKDVPESSSKKESNKPPTNQPDAGETKKEVSKPAAEPPVASNAKKDKAQTRAKKQTAAAKNGSLLPSAYKLEHLKAAVSAAGNADNLLLIMHHVEEAGGKSEVSESIEAYRVLKTVLEEETEKGSEPVSSDSTS